MGSGQSWGKAALIQEGGERAQEGQMPVLPRRDGGKGGRAGWNRAQPPDAASGSEEGARREGVLVQLRLLLQISICFPVKAATQDWLWGC